MTFASPRLDSSYMGDVSMIQNELLSSSNFPRIFLSVKFQKRTFTNLSSCFSLGNVPFQPQNQLRYLRYLLQGTGRQRTQDGILRQALRQFRFGTTQQLLVQPSAGGHRKKLWMLSVRCHRSFFSNKSVAGVLFIRYWRMNRSLNSPILYSSLFFHIHFVVTRFKKLFSHGCHVIHGPTAA